MRREESDVIIPCYHKRSARLEYNLLPLFKNWNWRSIEQIFQITLCISSITEYGAGRTQCATTMELWSLFHLAIGCSKVG